MKKIFVCVLLITSIGFSQTKNPEDILKKVKSTFEKVKDYQVEAKIKVNLEFLQVPDMNVKIFFKQPDKVKLDSKDFAMLPKQAFNFSPVTYLNGKHNAVLSGMEGKNVAVIKIIPDLKDSSDFLLATLWVDTDRNVINKIETTGKRGGTTRVEMNYPSDMKYPLPSKINFYIEIPGGIRLPADPRDKRNDSQKKAEAVQGGKITITYSNYQVNKGISDKVFK